MDDALLNATICKGVATGHCVMLADTKDGALVYLT